MGKGDIPDRFHGKGGRWRRGAIEENKKEGRRKESEDPVGLIMNEAKG
jgi:hypothetical protein